MSYSIVSTTVDGANIVTLVEYTFTDNSTKQVEVTHFMPVDAAAVIVGIQNREVSEQRMLDAAVTNAAIKATLDGQ